MVYDEGFSLEFEEFSFFAFFKYTIELEKTNISYKSFCHSALTGWYNNKAKSEWGCFQASKLNIPNKNQATFVKIKNNFQNDASHQMNKVMNYNKLTSPSLKVLTPADKALLVRQQSYEFPAKPGIPSFGGAFHAQPIAHSFSPFVVGRDEDFVMVDRKPAILISPNIYNFKQVKEFNKAQEKFDNRFIIISDREKYWNGYVKGNEEEKEENYTSFNLVDKELFKHNYEKDSKKINEKNDRNENDGLFDLEKNCKYLDLERIKRTLEEKKKKALDDKINQEAHGPKFATSKFNLFQNIHKVEELNKMNKSWEAGLYSDFAFQNNGNLINKKSKKTNTNLTNTQQSKNKNKKIQFSINSSSLRFKTKQKTSLNKNLKFKSAEAAAKAKKQIFEPFNTEQVPKAKLFPREFNWVNLLRPAARQGNCGSCYAISTLRMAEARLRLFYNHFVELSVQHVLDCSFYNQGCDGGYAYLVMKFANEFELIPKSCKVHSVKKINFFF